jgi:RNA polymerase sigma-70 factor (ECF subfamily)
VPLAGTSMPLQQGPCQAWNRAHPADLQRLVRSGARRLRVRGQARTPAVSSAGLPQRATLCRRPASNPDVSAATFRIDVPADLLLRAQQGEMTAFEQIYRLFERPGYTLALRLTGDPEAARDALHEAMLCLFERIGQFRGESPFWGWLRRIVVNAALMRMRRERARDLEAEIDEADLDVDATPAWRLADTRALEQALARLPALTRSVLWLYHVEEYTHPEIAELTGRSVSFSKSRVARGTARLRALIAPAEEAPPCLMPSTP